MMNGKQLGLHQIADSTGDEPLIISEWCLMFFKCTDRTINLVIMGCCAHNSDHVIENLRSKTVETLDFLWRGSIGCYIS